MISLPIVLNTSIQNNFEKLTTSLANALWTGNKPRYRSQIDQDKDIPIFWWKYESTIFEKKCMVITQKLCYLQILSKHLMQFRFTF